MSQWPWPQGPKLLEREMRFLSDPGPTASVFLTGSTSLVWLWSPSGCEEWAGEALDAGVSPSCSHVHPRPQLLCWPPGRDARDNFPPDHQAVVYDSQAAHPRPHRAAGRPLQAGSGQPLLVSFRGVAGPRFVIQSRAALPP